MKRLLQRLLSGSAQVQETELAPIVVERQPCPKDADSYRRMLGHSLAVFNEAACAKIAVALYISNKAIEPCRQIFSRNHAPDTMAPELPLMDTQEDAFDANVVIGLAVYDWVAQLWKTLGDVPVDLPAKVFIADDFAALAPRAISGSEP